MAVVDRGGIVAIAGDVDRPFPLASVTKVLTATAVLVAIEEGTLELERPAGPPGSTVAHLAAHASGLGPDGSIVTAPGRRRIYSNAGFDVLADTLGTASGMPWERYADAGVLEPLGMRSTAFVGSAAAGAHSTVHDLALLATAWLSPGMLLAETTVRLASRVWFPGLSGILPGFGRQSPNDWGFGVEIRARKHPHWTGTRNAPSTFGHFGQSGTCWWVDPNVAHALVVLTDAPFGPWAARAWPDLSDRVLDVIDPPSTSPKGVD